METRARYRVDGTVFIPDDPVAQATDWTPLKRGGASFRTHKLVEVSPERIEFRPTIGMWLFGAIFLVPGVIVAVLGIWQGVTGSEDGKTALFLVIWGVLFAAGGALVLHFGCRRAVFDFADHTFQSGRKNSYRDAAIPKPGKSIPFDQLHAFQIIAESCSSGKGGAYTSYELNLVLKDGRRRNVTDHGNLAKLRRDIEVLNARLKLPLWDNAQATCSHGM